MNEASKGRFVGWFWQAEAIRESQKQVAGKSPGRTKLEEYAMTAAEAGDRALHPVTPFRSGSGVLVSTLLHKESIRTTLRALGRNLGDESLHAVVSRALPQSVSYQRLRELVAESLPIDGALGDLRVRPAETEALAGVARALLDLARAPERQLQRAFARRYLRTGVVALVLALAAVFAADAGARIVRGSNLADGRPWRASSVYKGFSPETGICDGRRTRIFFHTNLEREPWVEVDLGEPTPITRVDVRNRRDCCRDRSFPLLIEGSLDGQAWQELGRRPEPFSTWTLRFEPTLARYVRAKALKRTFLHLESLEVR